MAKITRNEALAAAKHAGIKFTEDFHALKTDYVILLGELARLSGYKRPTNASGSKSRYFFYHLAKLNGGKRVQCTGMISHPKFGRVRCQSVARKGETRCPNHLK